jgi:ApaG protein
MNDMYSAVTRQVEVSVSPEFLPQESSPERGTYFWAYTVEITNHGEDAVQLIDRYWSITDGRGRLQEVKGPGVVGEQPLLRPGETFRYTSGCPLETPDGIMVGHYGMVDELGERFEVAIPAFPLDSPHVRKVLN